MIKRKQPEKTEFEKRLEAKTAQEAPKTEAEVNAEEPEEPIEADALDLEKPVELEPLPDIDVAALMEERDRFKDQLLRARAEFENYRKRMERDADRQRKTAAASVIRDLLPVLDNLERALEHANDESGGLAQGVEMVLKQLHEVLARHGVGPIATVGQPFTPDLHEAMLVTKSAEVPPGHVAQELQKGYRLGERVLRHAKVAVSAEPSESAAPETEEAFCESGTPETELEERSE